MRRRAVILAACLLAVVMVAKAEPQRPAVRTVLDYTGLDYTGLDYLEDTAGKEAPYLPPSRIDPRFMVAFYVNTAGSGPNAQHMWVLQRTELGGPWQLALWDRDYWAREGLAEGQTPPYSWPVSTGRKYPGDAKSGPTPRGVFALDERPYRMARGYTIEGMINVLYIDFHYPGGRRSGVAFHGTTHGRYGRLGTIASHGCIRMTQPNALALIDRLQGRDGVLPEAMRWGEVPRFWTQEQGGNRFGFTRDGTPHPLGDIEAAGSAPADPPAVLTKTGYRAVAVIFRD